VSEPDQFPDPSTLLPPPGMLRARLARALRDVDILRGLLRLSEAVARRDGRQAVESDYAATKVKEELARVR
jgi:hypothetical protein